MKYSAPERVVIISSGSQTVSVPKGDWIVMAGDLGHVGDILSGKKPYRFAAHGPITCTLALLAYVNECDFIMKEQDLLAFGPWVDRMYEEAGDHGIMIGRQQSMPVANSLALVKHWAIPEFVQHMISGPIENTDAALGEHRMKAWAEAEPTKVGFYSFGVDRDRPLPIDDPIWYAQKFTATELKAVADKGLIDITGMPEIERFTND